MQISDLYNNFGNVKHNYIYHLKIFLTKNDKLKIKK